MCVVLFLFCGGEESRVLRGEEGQPLNAHRRSELCANRNCHRSYKCRLGLFIVSRCMSLLIDSINELNGCV
jgi:hypothetical protein